MNDVLNTDMINAIDAVEITEIEKATIREVLFIERNNKDKEWDSGEAADEFNKLVINAVDTDDNEEEP